MSEIILLKTFYDKMEAEIVRGYLETAGIEVIIEEDDAGGYYPSLDLTDGVHILVREEDYDDALAILDDVPAYDEDDDDDEDEPDTDDDDNS